MKITFSRVTREGYKVNIRCSIKDERGCYHEGFGQDQSEALENAQKAHQDAKEKRE